MRLNATAVSMDKIAQAWGVSRCSAYTLLKRVGGDHATLLDPDSVYKTLRKKNTNQVWPRICLPEERQRIAENLKKIQPTPKQ